MGSLRCAGGEREKKKGRLNVKKKKKRKAGWGVKYMSSLVTRFKAVVTEVLG